MEQYGKTATEMFRNFHQDLLEAQKEIEGVDKDGKNPFFKSEYTTLNATILACKEILNKHNIMVLQPIESDENGVYVATTLYHTSGQSITSKMAIVPAKSNDPQAQGSAITYARRYSLKSMLCMSDADDDGEKAMARTEKPTVETPRDLIAHCPVHDVTMPHFQKGDREWWSHKLEDGTWCNGKAYANDKLK